MHSKTSKHSSIGLKKQTRSTKREVNKRLNYVADFETTTDPMDCRVWGWGLVTILDRPSTVDDTTVGSTLESFCLELSHLGNAAVYFHNLAFDGSFIIDFLLNNGYKHVEEYPVAGEFTTLISDSGKFYNIKVHWLEGGITEFRDSLKKLPLSVNAIAKSFKMETLKLDIDYHEFRPIDHKLTDDERLYIAHDVVIVANALREQFAQGMTALTVGSDSLAEYKRLTGKSLFERMFPVLSDSMDAEIRKAYRGGWTYCDPRFSRSIVESQGSVFDVNSLYPSVMAYELLPYGIPLWVDFMPDELPEDYPLMIFAMTFTAKLKPNHVPCIQVKGTSIFATTEYVSEINDPITLSLTNVDYELWCEQYDIDMLSFEGGWLFKGAYGMFDEYVNKWMLVKNSSEGGLKLIAKLHLNSLYGKFATNPNVTGKFPVLDDKGIVKLVLGPPETRNPVYTAMGVFITAYARRITITAAQANYPHFAYADTDSVHVLTREPVGIEVDPDRLGAWKHEYDFDRAMFWRAKAYTEQEPDGTMHTHIAGLPRSVAERVTFDDYYTGKVFPEKLLPRRVKGGIVLTTTEFTLN